MMALIVVVGDVGGRVWHPRARRRGEPWRHASAGRAERAADGRLLAERRQALLGL